MDKRRLRGRIKPSGAMEKKSSGKKTTKKARTSKPPHGQEVQATAASLLTDDLIVEILSRLPARSVHRFKCVSPSWRDLIAAHRKRLPHTLAGFLYRTYHREDPRFHDHHFANVSAGAAPPLDPSLSFLPSDKFWYVAQQDACNGLLLCLGHMFPSPSSTDENEPLEWRYIVCNPATEKWIDLPHRPHDHEVSKNGSRVFARLAFDPAASSHFHILQFEVTDEVQYITGVDIYSSKTGAWNYRKTRLPEKICLYSGLTSVFFRGMMHLLGWRLPMEVDNDAVIVAVDMEGQVWNTIPVPSAGLCFDAIGLSQGCLHYASTPIAAVEKRIMKKKKNKEDTSLANKAAIVWCMKDYDSKEWVLKHSVSNRELRRITGLVEYKVAAIHPDQDTIFLDSTEVHAFASYDMQRREFRHILNLKENKAALYLPYVPLFSDSLAGADGHWALASSTTQASASSKNWL